MKTDPSIFGWLREKAQATAPSRWIVTGTWNGRHFYRVFDDRKQAVVVAGFYGFTVEVAQ